MKKNKSVGSLIKAKRKSMECSQEAIATELGVSIKFISLVENGERQLPVNHFPKLAEFLEISLKELFNAKLYEEKTQLQIRRMRKELIEESGEEVNRALRLKKMKELRVTEIDELLKYLSVQKEDYIAQAKVATIEKNRVENQIKLLTEEKELLGFGQMQMNVGG